MKNKYIIISVILLAITSCKKEQSATESSDKNKLYNIAFNAGGFSQQSNAAIGNLAPNATTSNILTEWTYKKRGFNYIVYDAAGKVIRQQIHNEKSDASFGVFTDRLAAGTYTVYFVGTEENISNQQSDHLYLRFEPRTDYKTTFFGFKQGMVLAPIYFKKFTLNVTNGNISQNVVLPRISSQVIVHINDVIPNNASYFRVIKSQEGRVVNLDGIPSYSQPTVKPQFGEFTSTFRIPASVLGKKDVELVSNVVNTRTATDITIQCYDGAGTLLASKKITNLSFQPNKQIILSGNLFGGAGTAGTTTTNVNGVWNTTVLNYSF